MGEGIVKEFEMDMYTLLYVKWIINKGLLHNTGNYSALCGSLDENAVWGRMHACIGMAESLCCPLETNTLLIVYTPIQNKKLKKIKTFI